jgi:hypothetical protein
MEKVARCCNLECVSVELCPVSTFLIVWEWGFKLVSVTRKVLVLPSGFDSVRLLGSTMQKEVAVRDKPWMI